MQLSVNIFVILMGLTCVNLYSADEYPEGSSLTFFFPKEELTSDDSPSLSVKGLSGSNHGSGPIPHSEDENVCHKTLGEHSPSTTGLFFDPSLYPVSTPPLFKLCPQSPIRDNEPLPEKANVQSKKYFVARFRAQIKNETQDDENVLNLMVAGEEKARNLIEVAEKHSASCFQKLLVAAEEEKARNLIAVVENHRASKMQNLLKSLIRSYEILKNNNIRTHETLKNHHESDW